MTSFEEVLNDSDKKTIPSKISTPEPWPFDLFVQKKLQVIPSNLRFQAQDVESPELDESPGPAPRFTALKAESDHGAQPTSVPGKLGILS